MTIRKVKINDIKTTKFIRKINFGLIQPNLQSLLNKIDSKLFK